MTFRQCQALLVREPTAADSSFDLQRSRTPGTSLRAGQTDSGQTLTFTSGCPRPNTGILLTPLCPATPRPRMDPLHHRPPQACKSGRPSAQPSSHGARWRRPPQPRAAQRCTARHSPAALRRILQLRPRPPAQAPALTSPARRGRARATAAATRTDSILAASRRDPLQPQPPDDWHKMAEREGRSRQPAHLTRKYRPSPSPPEANPFFF